MLKHINRKVAVFVLAMGASIGLAWAYPPSEFRCCQIDCADVFPTNGVEYNACVNDCLLQGICHVPHGGR